MQRLKRAFTLIEVMVAIGITAVVVTGVSVFINRQQMVVKDMEVRLIIRSLSQSIEQVLSNPQAIATSIKYSTTNGNILLKNCISKSRSPFPLVRQRHDKVINKQGQWNNQKNDAATLTSVVNTGDYCSSKATNPEKQVPFELFLPFSSSRTLTPAELEKNVVAGDINNPQIYSIRTSGKPCNRKKEQAGCDFKVYTFFWASCPPDLSDFVDDPNSALPSPAATCQTAQTLNFRYQIVFDPTRKSSYSLKKYVYNVKGVGVIHRLKNVPDNKLFWMNYVSRSWSNMKSNYSNLLMSPTGAITMPVSIIPSLGEEVSGVCPLNFTMTGIKDGKPICECLFPYKLLPDTLGIGPGLCMADEQNCNDPNKRYRGIDENGNIICQKVKCEKKQINWKTNTGGCKTGGWIESIRPIPQKRGTKKKKLPSSSCKVEKGCTIGKWGGSCQSPVSCYEEINCCYESPEIPR